MNRPTLAVAVSLVFAAAVQTGTAVAQETSIRTAHFIGSPKSGFRSVFNTWQERVNAEGQGIVRIPSVVSDESIPGTQMPTALRNGVIDMAVVPPSYYYNLVPEGESTVLAQVPPAEQRKRGSLAILQEQLGQKMNAVLLGQYGYNVQFHVFLTKPVSKLEDFKPLKLRTTPAYRPFFSRLVSAQIQTARGEVYTALERGVVDGYANPLSEVKAAGWDRVTKYRVDPGFYNTMVHILVNKRFWEGLRSEQRAFLEKMAQGVLEGELDPKMAAAEITAGQELEKGGIKTITMDPASAAQYYKIAYDAHWDAIAKDAPATAGKLRELISK